MEGYVAMPSESVRHGLIASKALAMLCGRVHSGMEVAGGVTIVANGRNRQPDVVVFPTSDDQGASAAATPVVVVEVVSPTTRVVDRFDKNVDYAETRSIQHYLMLSEDRPSAVLCSRVAEGWISIEKEGAEAVELPAIGVELPLDEIYSRIVFAAGAI